MNEVLVSAILSGVTVKLDYQENPRHVIPLVLGRLKNGVEALLCYKIDEAPDGTVLQSIRIYYLPKVANVHQTHQVLPFSRKIDYYLKRHFKTIYAQVG